MYPYKLLFSEIEHTSIISAALNELAVTPNNVLKMTARGNWLLDLQDQANKKESPKEFTNLVKGSVKYPHELGPEKHPVNRIYFENHPSLSCEYLNFVENDKVEILSTTVKIFDSSAITVACTIRIKNYNEKYNVDEAVEIIKSARSLAQQNLYNAIEAFTGYWNRLVPSAKLAFGGMREFLLFDKFEYVNFDLIPNGGILDIDDWVHNKRYDLLKELTGFSRMSNHYTWTSFSEDFLLKFLGNDISNRNNEYWMIFRERFVRYYPDRRTPEAAHFASFIPLIIEILLGLKAVYKSYLEYTRKKISELPIAFNKENVLARSSKKAELRQYQQELANTTVQLSKVQFPSDVEFYANTEHAHDMLKQLENVLALPQLSQSLKTEQDKLKGVIDSYSNLSIHYDNMSLQRNVVVLTIMIAIIGSTIAIVEILVELGIIRLVTE